MRAKTRRHNNAKPFRSWQTSWQWTLKCWKYMNGSHHYLCFAEVLLFGFAGEYEGEERREGEGSKAQWVRARMTGHLAVVYRSAICPSRVMHRAVPLYNVVGVWTTDVAGACTRYFNFHSQSWRFGVYKCKLWGM